MSMLSLTEETIEEMKKQAADIPGLEAWEDAAKSWIALMPEPVRAQAEAMSQPLAAASAMSAYGFATYSQMMGLFMSNMNTIVELAEKGDLSSFDDKAVETPASEAKPAAKRRSSGARAKSAKRSPARRPVPVPEPAKTMLAAAETVAFDVAHIARDAADVAAHAVVDAVELANEDVRTASAITQEMIAAIMPEDFVPPASLKKPARPDDLKRIDGVGPKLEQVLNGMGIWTFEQIARLSAAEIAWVDDYLQFSGRIMRDDWLGQAAKLAGTGNKD